MSNIDLGDRKSTNAEEALLLKLLADYNFDLSNLYKSISSCRIQRIINAEFGRVYELMREIMYERSRT